MVKKAKKSPVRAKQESNTKFILLITAAATFSVVLPIIIYILILVAIELADKQ